MSNPLKANTAASKAPSVYGSTVASATSQRTRSATPAILTTTSADSTIIGEKSVANRSPHPAFAMPTETRPAPAPSSRTRADFGTNRSNTAASLRHKPTRTAARAYSSTVSGWEKYGRFVSGSGMFRDNTPDAVTERKKNRRTRSPTVDCHLRNEEVSHPHAGFTGMENQSATVGAMQLCDTGDRIFLASMPGPFAMTKIVRHSSLCAP
jgi:hypothetical protein